MTYGALSDWVDWDEEEEGRAEFRSLLIPIWPPLGNQPVLPLNAPLENLLKSRTGGYSCPLDLRGWPVSYDLQPLHQKVNPVHDLLEF